MSTPHTFHTLQEGSHDMIPTNTCAGRAAVVGTTKQAQEAADSHKPLCRLNSTSREDQHQRPMTQGQPHPPPPAVMMPRIGDYAQQHSFASPALGAAGQQPPVPPGTFGANVMMADARRDPPQTNSTPEYTRAGRPVVMASGRKDIGPGTTGTDMSPALPSVPSPKVGRRKQARNVAWDNIKSETRRERTKLLQQICDDWAVPKKADPRPGKGWSDALKEWLSCTLTVEMPKDPRDCSTEVLGSLRRLSNLTRYHPERVYTVLKSIQTGRGLLPGHLLKLQSEDLECCIQSIEDSHPITSTRSVVRSVDQHSARSTIHMGEERASEPPRPFSQASSQPPQMPQDGSKSREQSVESNIVVSERHLQTPEDVSKGLEGVAEAADGAESAVNQNNAANHNSVAKQEVDLMISEKLDEARNAEHVATSKRIAMEHKRTLLLEKVDRIGTVDAIFGDSIQGLRLVEEKARAERVGIESVFAQWSATVQRGS